MDIQALILVHTSTENDTTLLFEHNKFGEDHIIAQIVIIWAIIDIRLVAWILLSMADGT